MEPVSAVASVVALLQLAQLCVQGISRLQALRKAPEELASLINEVSDLEAVLSQAAVIGQQTGGSQQPRGPVLALNAQVQRATTQLHELHHIVERHLARHTIGRGAVKARIAWIRERSRVASLQRDLRLTRLNLSAALGVVNSSVLTRVELSLQRIATQHEEDAALLSTLLISFCGSQAQTLVYPIGNQNQAPPLEALAPSELPQEGVTVSSAPLSESTRRALISVAACHRFNYLCKQWCSCACHCKTNVRTPQPLRAVMGLLFVGYTGLPVFTPSCDDKSCRRRVAPSIDITYYFPAWFLSRALALSFTVSTSAGPYLNLRMPRIVGWGSALWSSSRAGDLGQVQLLFAQGIASPYDINAYGQSALHYAARFRQLDLSDFLIKQGANINQQDDNGRTPADSAWDLILSGSLPSTDSDTTTRLFAGPGYLESRQFSRLHKLVLGLAPGSLSAELTKSLPPDIVNHRDANGRTPLSWAASRRNHDAMRLLIKAGASPRTEDDEGNPPLFHAIRASDREAVRILLESGADVSKRNVFGGTFLHTACQNKDDPVLVEMLASVPLPIDAVDLKGDSALTYATWQDHTENVRKLLDLGAQPERLNAVGDGAINMAVYHNAPACLGVLLERNVAVSHVNSRSETLLHAAGLVPRVETIRRLAEADLHTLDPAALDINGKSYKDYFMERADLRDLDLVEAFGLLVAHVEKAHT